MASGRTHDIVNLVAFPPIVYYLHPVQFVSFTVGYMVGTFLLSPDNDIYNSSPNRRWRFLRFIWYPYTKLFSHRGVSHIPFYGTATKLLYLSSITIFVVFLLKIILSGNFDPDHIDRYLYSSSQDYNIFKDGVILSFFTGLFIAEIVHILTDKVYSILKPKRRKKKR